jgi:hypothetical protein
MHRRHHQHHRLRQGPVDLGPVGALIEDRLSAAAPGLSFEVGGAVFALGAPGAPSGLRLRDVALRRADGEIAAAAPELAVDFHVFDLLQGILAPVRLSLIGVEAALRREPDGRLRPAGGPGGRAAGFLALLDAAARGEGPLRRLREIAGRRASVTLRDAATGRAWRLEEAAFSVRREGGGELGRLEGVLREADRPGAAGARVTLEGVRPGPQAPIRLGLRVADLSLGRLPGAGAAGLTALAGLRASGNAAASLDPEGRPTRVEADLAFAPTALPGPPAPLGRIERGGLRLAWAAGGGGVEIRRLALAGPAGALAVSGRLRPWGGGAGAPAQGAALALRVERLELGRALGLAEPLVFGDGELRADLRRDPRRLEVSRLRLVSPAVTAQARGAVALGPAGAEAALRFETGPFSTATLKRAWPEAAAPKAREWVAEHIGVGRVTGASGSFWRAPGRRPEMTLDFGFAGVEAEAVRGLPPIRDGAGEGRVTLRRFDLTLDRGRVTPPGGAPIALDGSAFSVPAIAQDPPLGRPAIRAEGRIADILALLDQPPLRLTRKLSGGLPDARGRAELRARLDFPMVRDLDPGRIEVAAEATLRDAALRPPGSGLTLEADRLALEADARRLRLRGRARLDGRAAEIDWIERFRPVPPGLEMPAGAAELRVDLAWSAPAGPPALSAQADLTPAALALPGLGWRKPAGAPARLEAGGRAEADGALELSRLSLSAGALSAQGAARIAAGGGLARLRLDALRLDGTLDLAAEVTPAPGGGRRVAVTGRRLDLGALARARGGAGTGGGQAAAAAEPPLFAELAIDAVALAEGVTLRDARGRLTREGGTTRAELTGAVNGGAPARLGYRQTAGAPATLTLRSADAGRLLADLGLAGAARGGALSVRAALPEDDGPVRGRAEIEDLRIAGDGTLGPVVAHAQRDGVLNAGAPGPDGYAFDRISAPFALQGQELRVAGALAAGPALGLKVDGSYHLGSGALDLDGVLTPAYAINGLLNRVPLIGRLFGGEGEGLIALTFSVQGTAEAPRISANPLSVLTPGVFRDLFGGLAPPQDGAPGDAGDILGPGSDEDRP